MKPITWENDRLEFVGIGYMRRPIAQRLLEAGCNRRLAAR
jgi:hypothetical protein